MNLKRKSQHDSVLKINELLFTKMYPNENNDNKMPKWKYHEKILME